MGGIHAAYADTHQPAWIRRYWSTWNALSTFLCSSDEIASNSMGLIGWPSVDDAAQVL
jgi:integrase/recombinase XerC